MPVGIMIYMTLIMGSCGRFFFARGGVSRALELEIIVSNDLGWTLRNHCKGVVCGISICQWFSTRGSVALQTTSGNILGHFGLSEPSRGITGIQCLDIRDAI